MHIFCKKLKKPDNYSSFHYCRSAITAADNVEKEGNRDGAVIDIKEFLRVTQQLAVHTLKNYQCQVDTQDGVFETRYLCFSVCVHTEEVQYEYHCSILSALSQLKS